MGYCFPLQWCSRCSWCRLLRRWKQFKCLVIMVHMMRTPFVSSIHVTGHSTATSSTTPSRSTVHKNGNRGIENRVAASMSLRFCESNTNWHVHFPICTPCTHWFAYVVVNGTSSSFVIMHATCCVNAKTKDSRKCINMLCNNGCFCLCRWKEPARKINK